MSKVVEMHKQAMGYAERALLARIQRDMERAVEHSRNALKCELAAIDAMDEPAEPTYSILHRSAGTLALDCNEIRQAEQIAAKALAQDPPSDIAEELRDLLEQVHFQRHLELRGIALGEGELQMNLAGPEVGLGFVRSGEFLKRVDDSSKLLTRIVERKRDLPFRERGRTKSGIADNFEMFVSVPRAASFSVTLKLGHPTKLLEFPELDETTGIVDEFMELMDLANNSKIPEIRERIPDGSYFRNFMALTKKIAPDGDKIRQVGFTVSRGGSTHHVGITRCSEDFKYPSEDESSDKKDQAVEVRGTLRFADATRSSSEIKIIDDGRKTYRVKVPEGMMNDIVRPMWDSVVEIRGRRDAETNCITLEEIQEAGEE